MNRERGCTVRVSSGAFAVEGSTCRKSKVNISQFVEIQKLNRQMRYRKGRTQVTRGSIEAGANRKKNATKKEV